MSADAISSDDAFELGRAAWPSIDLAVAAFRAFAEARLETWRGNADRAADIYLACACVERLPVAIAEFLSSYAERIPLYLGRLARDPDLVAEVRQVVVTRCLVGDEGKAPALTMYSATGSLEGWLRATAVREALALQREKQRHTHDVEAALEARVPWADREVSLFKQMYQEPVRNAFATACAELDAQDRALLRLHYVDGVTTANLATMFGISRATLVRRLASARESLVEHVRITLKSVAGVADQDFDSVVKLVRSQIDLRLSVILKSAS